MPTTGNAEITAARALLGSWGRDDDALRLDWPDCFLRRDRDVLPIVCSSLVQVNQFGMLTKTKVNGLSEFENRD